MPVSHSVTTQFLEILQKWTAGAISRDSAESTFQIHQLRACSPLLAGNPEFEFHNNGNGVTSTQAFEHMVLLLESIMHARLRTEAKN